MKQPLLRCLALVLGLFLLLAPARAQVLRGTFAAGNAHSLSIHADGTLWATGFNSFGQLGLPTTTASTSTWVQVGTATNWIMVAAGLNFSLGLQADGSLWAWGDNAYGQLGNPTTIRIPGTVTDIPNPTPTRVGTERYTQIAAGRFHSLGLRADGTLWAWGFNRYGQLGTATNSGTMLPNPTPTQVGTDLYTQVAAGTSHCLALRADGALYAWGYNYQGQLGTTTNSETTLPTTMPTRVGTDLYTQLAAGGFHSAALRANGTLWAWGSNYNGQLGNALGITASAGNPVPVQVGTGLYSQVVAGYDYTLGLRADATLWAWGSNYYGQLGNETNKGTDTANPLPTQVGSGRYVQVAASVYHSLGLRADGTLWAWGDNRGGQLGAAASTINPTPTATGTALPTRSTASGTDHSLAVRADGTLWSWGNNLSGQLGNGTTTKSLVPMQVGTDRDWVMVAGGSSYSLGLKANGELYAWGLNLYGQLGVAAASGTTAATPTPTRVGTDLYTRIATGDSHSLALRADGTLWSWGGNNNGELGRVTDTRTTMANPTPTQAGTALYTQLAAGSYHSLGLRPDGTLWSWGINSDGQLGNTVIRTSTSTALPVGTALYTQVAAGGYHSLGLRADGSLYAWGSNFYGQLGNAANTSNTSIFTSNPTPTRVGTDLYTQVAGGQYYTLGLRPNGTLWAWGYNREGQLGRGDDSRAVVNYMPTQEITAGTGWATLAHGSSSLFSLVRTASGLTFASAGLNFSGQLGDGTTAIATRFDRLRPLGTAQPLPVLAATPTGPGLALYPNPASGRVTALYGAAPGAAVLVLDALGRQVLAATADAAGTARLRLPASLGSGMYLVRTGRQALRLSVE